MCARVIPPCTQHHRPASQCSGARRQSEISVPGPLPDPCVQCALVHHYHAIPSATVCPFIPGLGRWLLWSATHAAQCFQSCLVPPACACCRAWCSLPAAAAPPSFWDPPSAKWASSANTPPQAKHRSAGRKVADSSSSSFKDFLSAADQLQSTSNSLGPSAFRPQTHAPAHYVCACLLPAVFNHISIRADVQRQTH